MALLQPTLARDYLPPDTAAALRISATATVTPAPQGMTSEVVFVRDNGRESVLKRCRNPVYIDWLRREHRVLNMLANCRLPIPRVLGYFELDGSRESADVWLHTNRLPGQSLWDLLLRSSERISALRGLGHLLRDLHAAAPPDGLKGEAPWIERMLSQARNNLSWCDGSPELLAQLEHTRPAPQPAVLIHGDLALDNVLIAGDGAMSLIDWSGGDLGDPRYDVALALSTEPEFQLREAEVAAFFDGYGTAPIDDRTMRWFRSLYEFF